MKNKFSLLFPDCRGFFFFFNLMQRIYWAYAICKTFCKVLYLVYGRSIDVKKKHTPCYSGAYEYQWEQSIPVWITNRQKITASLVRKVFIGSTKGSNDGNILPLSAPNFWLTSSLSGKPKHSLWVPTLVSPGSLSLEVFRVLVVINLTSVS